MKDVTVAETDPCTVGGRPDLQLIAAAITPFTADGDLDVEGARATFEHLRSSGIDAVFTPGTSGEFTSLSIDEREHLLREALAVFGPAAVFAHVGAATTRDTKAVAQRAADLGARVDGARKLDSNGA